MKKIKINKNEFIKYLEYRKKINKYELSDLDLSEFNIKLTKKEFKELLFSGLDNFYIIKMLLKDKL